MNNILKLFFVFHAFAYSISADNCMHDDLISKQYLKKAISDKNYTEAYKLIKQACKKGCINSCNTLGGLHSFNDKKNLYRDNNLSYKIFLQACYDGLGISCINASKLLETNDAEKLKLLKRAMELKVLEAYRYLGDYYKSKKEIHIAITMYENACNAGIRDACLDLAVLYRDGLYVQKNLTLSDAYSKKAGLKNHNGLEYIMK